MFHRPNASSGVPIYVQLKEQVRHAIETGALNPGDQLPAMRNLAEILVINPNTAMRVYRELEQEGILEIRHGLGVFVAVASRKRLSPRQLQVAQSLIRGVVRELHSKGLDTGEIRRLFEAELITEKESLGSRR